MSRPIDGVISSIAKMIKNHRLVKARGGVSSEELCIIHFPPTFPFRLDYNIDCYTMRELAELKNMCERLCSNYP